MDEQYVLTTPENVPISYELAGIGSRLVATVIDGLIISALQIGLIVVAFIAALIAPGSFREILGGIVILIAFLLSFAMFLGYPLLFEIIWSGQTPGKRKARIRIVQNDGGPITATAVVIRNIVRLVDFLPAYYIIGIAVMLIDRKCRRLGDLTAGTICVKERYDLAVGQLDRNVETWVERDRALRYGAIDNLSQLSHEDLRLVQEYLTRRDRISPDASYGLAVQIANGIAAKLDVDLGDESPKDFLVRLGMEMRRADVYRTTR